MVGSLQGTSEVTVAISSPGETVEIELLDVHNPDTAAATVLVKIYDTQKTAHTRRRRTLQPNDSATIYDRSAPGWIENGERLVLVLAAAITTTQPNYQVRTRRVAQ